MRGLINYKLYVDQQPIDVAPSNWSTQPTRVHLDHLTVDASVDASVIGLSVTACVVLSLILQGIVTTHLPGGAIGTSITAGVIE